MFCRVLGEGSVLVGWRHMRLGFQVDGPSPECAWLAVSSGWCGGFAKALSSCKRQ